MSYVTLTVFMKKLYTEEHKKEEKTRKDISKSQRKIAKKEKDITLKEKKRPIEK